MSWIRPTLAGLIARNQADIATRLEGADAVLRRTVLNVLARVQAGAVHGLYGFLDWMAKQTIIDTAEAEYLARHASIWSITRKAAQTATGDITFTGIDGSVIPAGSLLYRADAVEFTTIAEVIISGTTATASVLADIAGAAANTDAGANLTLASPVEGVEAQAVVATGGIAAGADIEPDEDLRGRLLTRIRQPPHGGASFDYIAWALEVSEVTRAWCYPLYSGLGTVGVTFVCDNQEGGIIPNAAKVQEVQDHIDLVRPVCADVTVFAPVDTPLDMTIAITPNTSAIKAAIIAELEDLLLREAEPGGIILLSHLSEAISLATGETDHQIVTPAADVLHDPAELASLGAITWQDV